MDWIEVVHIRTSEKKEFMNALELCRRVEAELKPQDNVGVQVCQNTTYKTDLSIVLSWDLEKENPAKTGFGVQLTECLSRFGLVDHQVWQPFQAGVSGQLLEPQYEPRGKVA